MKRLGRLTRPSIALRMSVWYAVSVFLLIFAASGALYLVLAANVEYEDERLEVDEVNNLRVMLEAPPEDGRPAVGHGPRRLYVRLMAPDGTVMRETAGMDALIPHPPLSWLRALPAHPVETEAVSGGRAIETQTAKLSWDGSDRAGYVQVTMDRSRNQKLLAVYREKMVLILTAALLATVLAGYFIVRSAMRPIRRISAITAEVGLSNLDRRIPREGLPVELDALAQAFNSMLDSLERAFAGVSRFSDDVAHELRTPISNMRGELEVALSRARTPEEYRETLVSALEECDRLGRIVRSLLFLARSDARLALQREPVDLARELDGVREFYDGAASEQGVALRLEVEAGLAAQLDRTLFQQAVGNLVANAIAHTGPGGEIWIRAERAPQGFRLEVADTGCGIAAEHLPHIFERFYRADPARSGGHVGLGLAVVRSIVERHGGSATVHSVPGKGTKVALCFPI